LAARARDGARRCRPLPPRFRKYCTIRIAGAQAARAHRRGDCHDGAIVCGSRAVNKPAGERKRRDRADTTCTQRGGPGEPASCARPVAAPHRARGISPARARGVRAAFRAEGAAARRRCADAPRRWPAATGPAPRRPGGPHASRPRAWRASAAGRARARFRAPAATSRSARRRVRSLVRPAAEAAGRRRPGAPSTGRSQWPASSSGRRASPAADLPDLLAPRMSPRLRCWRISPPPPPPTRAGRHGPLMDDCATSPALGLFWISKDSGSGASNGRGAEAARAPPQPAPIAHHQAPAVVGPVAGSCTCRWSAAGHGEVGAPDGARAGTQSLRGRAGNIRLLQPPDLPLSSGMAPAEPVAAVPLETSRGGCRDGSSPSRARRRGWLARRRSS
jgi:hypothetical protein